MKDALVSERSERTIGHRATVTTTTTEAT